VCQNVKVLCDMQRAMVDFPDDFRPTIRCLSLIISEKYETSTLAFTDGFKSADGAGLGVYVPGVRQIRYRLHEPSSVFKAEVSALLNALLFIKSSYPVNISSCLTV
jgi:hypothetical protein